MKVEQQTWTIEQLSEKKIGIELQPMWQRGPAWKEVRQVLLIDSILRGMDIPKVYLRKLSHGAFTHDAVDGQQRLRAIWAFHEGALKLTFSEPLPPIEGEPIHGKGLSALSEKLRDRFTSFPVSIGEITTTNTDEIRNLFARLQMGVSLNPAELRNAMEGPLRYSVDSTARLHPFFKTCKISSDRYKHLDYAAHAYAIAAFQGSRDIKAPDLREMISEYGVERGSEVLALSSLVDEALSLLAEVNESANYSIRQKWIFVDLVWLIMQRQGRARTLSAAQVFRRFQHFEVLRRRYNRAPEALLVSNNEHGLDPVLAKHLYDYIVAFKSQGGLRGNLVTRNKALTAFLA